MSDLSGNDSSNVHQAKSAYAFDIIHKRHIKSKRNVDGIAYLSVFVSFSMLLVCVRV